MRTFLNKSLLTLGLIITLSGGTTFAQTVKWDSTYRPGKYKEIVTKWKTEPTTKKDYIF
jgi:hypothetical protein